MHDPLAGLYMTVFSLCKEFGWTYEELREQPSDIIEAFIVILNAQNETYKQENRKMKAKRR